MYVITFVYVINDKSMCWHFVFAFTNNLTLSNTNSKLSQKQQQNSVLAQTDKLMFTASYMWPWPTKPVISSRGIFVAIAKNTCIGQNDWFFFYAKIIRILVKDHVP